MKRLDPRSVIIGFLVAVIGFLLIGAKVSHFDTIRVNEIILNDKGLTIRDELLNPILMIGQDAGGNGLLRLTNKDGVGVVVLNQSKEMDGSIKLNTSEGRNRISLGLTKGNSGSLRLYNYEDQETISLSHFEKKGIIQIENEHQKRVVYLASTSENDGHIILSDRYGDSQWSVTGKRN